MPEFTYENQDDDDLGDRGMVPLQALELAVDGGWEMREFVEKLRGEHGQESQEIAQMWLGTGGFLLTPEFWMCLGRALCGGPERGCSRWTVNPDAIGAHSMKAFDGPRSR
jgi:hypothetical protein